VFDDTVQRESSPPVCRGVKNNVIMTQYIIYSNLFSLHYVLDAL